MSVFGTTRAGETVRRLLLRAGDLEVALLTHGARIQDLRLAGAPLTLGTEDLAAYEGPLAAMGALIAPVANRIRHARAPLDGRLVALEANEGGHTLHGGSGGTQAKVWTVEAADGASAVLSVTLPDGEAGFPGTRRIRARFAVQAPATLTLDVEAATDAPTWINVANHSYWRLGETLRGHRLRVVADRYLPAGRDGMATGEVAPAEGAFDLREGRTIDPVPDLDHCFCLSSGRRPLTPAAWLEGPRARLEIATTEPGLQVFTGWKLEDVGATDHEGRPFGPHAGIALEPQGWPDAPNHSDWPSVRLDLGETYRQTTRWRFEGP